MLLFYCPNIINGDNFLNPEESRHCIKVLRKNTGDQIEITDGIGNFYIAILTEVNHRKCFYKILSSYPSKPKDYSIHIAIAPTKNTDRIEWFVEKSVEIGISKITFIQTAFSERKTINMDRIMRKAISAMKQSMRSYLPEFSRITKFTTFIDSVDEAGQKFIAHLDNEQTEHLQEVVMPESDKLIIIGPEGGFTNEEISLAKNKHFKPVKIGDHRLRTETAGIVACTMLNNII